MYYVCLFMYCMCCNKRIYMFMYTLMNICMYVYICIYVCIYVLPDLEAMLVAAAEAVSKSC